MAGEEASVAPAASQVALSEHEKKRKLEDLGTDVPEPLAGDDLDSKAADEQKYDSEEKSEGSELKRPRIEDNEDNNGQLDDRATENGYQGENKVDNSREYEEDKVNQQQVAVEIALDSSNDQNKTIEDPASAKVDQQASGELQIGNEEPSIEIEKPKADNDKAAINPVAQDPYAVVAEEQDVSTIDPGSGSEIQTTSRKMEVPNNKVGVLIGKSGDTIRYLQYNSGAKIQIMRDADSDPQAATRPVELIGTLESINKAEKLINDVIAEADAGGSPSLVARGFSTVQSIVGDQLEIKVLNEKVGLIIGKGGETIKNLQTSSGARIQLVPQHLPAGDQSKERIVRVTGDRKQIEIAREMIKEVMEQHPRPSPLSSGYSQQAFRPRGPVAPLWRSRGPPSHHAGYDYQQRGPYPSQNQSYHQASYGNYPQQQAPRSSFGPSWDQRPPSAMPPLQANYNYGQPNPFLQSTGQSYGQGYNDVKYENQMPSQHPYSGHGVPQTGYPQGSGSHPGYGPQDQYARPYGMHPQAPGQNYGQPRPNQPGELSYQAPVTSTQAYGSNMPPQQSYPYASSGPVQQTYPPYSSGPTSDGYHQPPPTTATGPGYPQQGGQPVSGYGQPGVQQPGVYSAGGPAGGYGSYSSQPSYTEQPATNNTAYGYQDAAYGSSTAAYGAPSTVQPGYAQPAGSQPGYDQSNSQSAVYGTAPAAPPASAPAPAGYGKSLSPQPVYPQYDTSQMYGASR